MLGILASLLLGARHFESRGRKDLRGIWKLLPACLPGVRWGEGRGRWRWVVTDGEQEREREDTRE